MSTRSIGATQFATASDEIARPLDTDGIDELTELFATDETTDRCWRMWFIVSYKDLHPAGRDGNRAQFVSYALETPRWLGHFMIVAGAAYIIDTVAHTVLANYADYAGGFLMMVLVPSIIAEGCFGLWLLRSGGSDDARPGR